jgi:RNA polymerase sigma-70 factor (ECF subfamily)
MLEIETFLSHKDYLFSIAYRITGSYQDSEDILQEAYLRSQKSKMHEIRNLRAYLGKIVAHLAFDILKKASRKKETYIGPYLPEPIPERYEPNNEEQIDFAFLVILETLNPIERAVYILREAFDYDYEWISEIVGKSSDNCRQLFKRSKESIQARKRKFDTSESEKSNIINEFIFACYTKDPTSLSLLLQKDIVAYSDGGGKVHAARIPISGLERTIRFIIKTNGNIAGVDSIYFTFANGQKAIVGYKNDIPVLIQTLNFNGNKISDVYNIVNPDKLRAFKNKEQLLQASLLQKISYIELIIPFFNRMKRQINHFFL